MGIRDKLLNFANKAGIDIQNLDEETILLQVADNLGIECHEPTPTDILELSKVINHPAFQKIPAKRWRELQAVPISVSEDSSKVLISDPFLPELAKELSFLLAKKDIQLYLTAEGYLNSFFEKIDKGISDAELILKLEDTSHLEIPVITTDMTNESSVKPEDVAAPLVIRLVDKIFSDAIEKSTSDIHLTPHSSGLEVRIRVDGILKELLSVPANLKNPVVARIKLLCGMDISEKRKPQDGRLRLKTNSGPIDLRISSVPSVYGENLVIRLLAIKSTQMNLDSLGMDTASLEKLKKMLKSSSKVILVSGPTGSGKTSTLYASLKHISDGTKNIITIEDPIEYRMENITQMQVNPKTDMTFAQGLRSALRQDPDVIMVGEIRDLETAQIAMQASQTGHLVLSTIHTNSAEGAVTRLHDLGVPNFLISSSVAVIIAQRLVRRLQPDGTLSGRIGIYSVLEITTDIGELIRQGAGEFEIITAAQKNGFKTLWDHGLELVNQGLTTLAEVERVLGPQSNYNCSTNKTQEITLNKKASGDFKKPTLLLVEDDDSTRAVLSMLFEEQFYEVIEATNGFEALERMCTDIPSVIVSDLMMPRMSGLELVKKIRSDSRLSAVPILMLTAAANEENELNLIEHGADDFVGKTSDSKVMLARVERLLSRALNQS